MPDKILGQRTCIVEDQLKASSGTVDSADPLFDSETEGDNCFYSVVEVNADEYRTGLNKLGSYYTRPGPIDKEKHETAEKITEEFRSVIKDYYLDGREKELSSRLKKIDATGYHDSLVVELIRSSFEQTPEIRAKLAGVVTLLHLKELISKKNILMGIEKVVESVEDYRLDFPNCINETMMFLETMIGNEIVEADVLYRLPHNFLDNVNEGPTIYHIEDINVLKEDLRVYKEKVSNFMCDFFNQASVGDVTGFLTDLGKPYFRHEFVRLIIRSSLGRTNREREIVSDKLDRLYGTVLTPDDIQLGMTRVIGMAEDIQLDSPDVRILIAKFLTRSVVDEILPPSFLVNNYRLHMGGVLGMTTLRKAQRWLTATTGKKRTEQFRQVWISGNLTNTEARNFKHDIKDAIDEYYVSLEKYEALRLIDTLCNTEDQEKEMVRKVIVFAIEKGDKYKTHAMELLKDLKTEYISSNCIIAGFNDLKYMLAEIQLDVPNAEPIFEDYVETAKEYELLPSEYGK